VKMRLPAFRTDLRVFDAYHGNHHPNRWFPRLYFPELRATLLFRLSQALFPSRLKPLSYLCARRLERAFGIWLGPRVSVGHGLLLHHARGLVCSPNARIGAFNTIMQRVTIGGPRTSTGTGVTIGANATLISTNTRSVHIGDFAFVAAGSVVTRDVEPRSIVAGNPARRIGVVDEDFWHRHRQYLISVGVNLE